MYKTPLSTDIIIYIGGCGGNGGGTGLRMNDDGRWPLGCTDDLHLYYKRIFPPLSLGRWLSLS